MVAQLCHPELLLSSYLAVVIVIPSLRGISERTEIPRKLGMTAVAQDDNGYTKWQRVLGMTVDVDMTASDDKIAILERICSIKEKPRMIITPSTHIDAIKDYLCDLQTQICTTFATIDGHAQFNRDVWQRPEGGGGITRVLEGGAVLEKAGVNFSHVFGEQLPPAASARRSDLQDRSFQALGLSLVFHPLNPFAPTTHLNVRFFIAEKPGAAPIWWFGGGFDLTPYYGFVEDAQHWHRCAKSACDPFGAEIYPQFKQWCDDYFYLKHRQEARGIGGIFFDDVNQWDFATCFAFMQSVGNQFIPAYEPILQRRKDMPYTPQQKLFQQVRRGRYVEFNLVYDRGTLFGLQSGGRTESILISLPPAVQWHYDWQAEPGSPEARLAQEFLKPRDWLSCD